LAAQLPPALVDKVRQVVSQSSILSEFGDLSDHEFVALTQSVAKLQSRIQELQEQGSELKTILSGEGEDHTFKDAIDVGKRAIELVHSCIGIEFALDSQFNTLDKLIDSCESIRSQFESNRVIFKSLAVGFAIEAARCDDESRAVFRTVADDFHRINNSIETTINESFQELEDVLKQIHFQREKWKNSMSSSQGSVEERLKHIRDDIYNIDHHLKPCLEDCDNITTSSRELSMSLAPILMSLQTQDATRQKLQHVVEVLPEMNELAHTKVNSRKRRIGKILAKASIQLNQLTAAQNDIRAASEQIFSGINRSISDSGTVVDNLEALEHRFQENFGNGRLAYTIGHDIQELSTITEASENVHVEIEALNERIQKVIAVFNHEISSRQQDISLIALNAQVAASRLEEGGALEKLAQETSTVSISNAATSSDLSKTLANALRNLKDARELSIEQVRLLNEEKTKLLKQTRNIDQHLEHFINNALRRSDSMRERSTQTKEEINRLKNQLTFPDRIDRDLSPSIAYLNEIKTLCERHLGKHVSSDHVIEELNLGKDRYTMDSERDAHDETFNHFSAPSPKEEPKQAARPTSPGEASGDLELF